MGILKIALLASLALRLRSVQAADHEPDSSLAELSGSSQKPNFIFIMTDDQDLHLNSLDYMPKLQRYLGNEGTKFEKHFCTIAVCCPSRVSLLTGRLAHNTNVTDVNPPYGGYPKFIAEGFNDRYLPVWLQEAGYNTYYTGKFLNAHSTSNYNKPFPKGWNGTEFLLDPSTYSYWNSTFQRNRESPVASNGYSTDIISQNSLAFINAARQSERPFFLGIAPIAPHAKGVHMENVSIPYFTNPVPAERHRDLFLDAQVPRHESFNPDNPSGASWIYNLRQLNASEVAYADGFYRSRIQSLQAVDDLVEAVILELQQQDLLRNTFVFFTADNGYHIGQHRMVPGKGCPYEEDINIPMIVRGPGVPRGESVNYVTSHTDIAPTLFDLAGIPLRSDFDGTPMPLKKDALDKLSASPRREHLNVEYWGTNLQEGLIGRDASTGSALGYGNNTYKALRVIGEGYNLFYSVWCTNEHELYEMTSDPYQMKNLFRASETEFLGYNMTKVISRLDALLLLLKSCKGAQCTSPWAFLHPGGDVATLRQALNPKYDAFYAAQPSISFAACEDGYFPEYEGPQQGGCLGYLECWGVSWSL
ncbi:sulfatase family protein [Aspergillus homomorphus CBS 101889]|uniref:Arylsulfatase n=1 Tax=Aspergillus homomorphus (strain CBS 101889) TaxID=1450537 RepID=A0A395HUZ6_ASPHC|nr:Arylsulphatase [Aspergillus homomorphus CBS 101889]RAL10658.1 Arylsulphatase [Aspergillus homomorphus CBS 101889]